MTRDQCLESSLTPWPALVQLVLFPRTPICGNWGAWLLFSFIAVPASLSSGQVESIVPSSMHSSRTLSGCTGKRISPLDPGSRSGLRVCANYNGLKIAGCCCLQQAGLGGAHSRLWEQPAPPECPLARLAGSTVRPPPGSEGPGAANSLATVLGLWAASVSHSIPQSISVKSIHLVSSAGLWVLVLVLLSLRV